MKKVDTNEGHTKYQSILLLILKLLKWYMNVLFFIEYQLIP